MPFYQASLTTVPSVWLNFTAVSENSFFNINSHLPNCVKNVEALSNRKQRKSFKWSEKPLYWLSVFHVTFFNNLKSYGRYWQSNYGKLMASPYASQEMSVVSKIVSMRSWRSRIWNIMTMSINWRKCNFI